MRIVIDYQGAQSGGSRNRGIGRYTSAVTRAMIGSARDTEIILLLNGAFDETIGQIREEFEGVLPQENIIVWHPLRPISHIQSANDDRRHASELLREAFIARLNPDALLITSHFEGSGDDGATTVGLLPSNYPAAIILYDLIPYIYRSIYLANPAVERWYEHRIGGLKRADMLLSISESSRREAVDYLGYPPDRAISISTAADPHFRRADLGEQDRKALFAKYQINKPFVMYTGGIDHRKNIEGLIRAFAKLPSRIRRAHQLAVVCSIRPEDAPRLQQIAREAGLADSDLILTGFVPENDLVALYSTCRLFVFPSWHEGFGLPALEAMHCGAPVITANSSSLPEVVGDPRAMFDPRDDDSISERMTAALGDEDFRKWLIENGSKRAAMFSWDTIGERAIVALNQAVARRARNRLGGKGSEAQLRLAMVTPAPPAQSGIAYYAATLIRALQSYYHIDVVLADGAAIDDPFILANCEVIDSSTFRSQAHKYDRIVYQFGNSDHHSHMVELIRDFPGVVVLHDFFVSDLSSWREHLEGVGSNWGSDLYESHGIGAVLERHSEKDLFSVINKYPCSYAVTRHAFGVLCHSEEARSLQVHWHGSEAAKDWTVVPMIRPKPQLPTRADARKALGIADDEFLVCAYGILGKSKLNHRLIEGWTSSQVGKHERSRLVFVGGFGAEDYHSELRSMIARKKAASRVEFSGWVGEQDYWRYLSAADVAVQLRGTTHGETSAATLDAMLAGLPVIANRSPSLPKEADHAIAYVPAEAPVDALAHALDQMSADSELRARMGSAAREYATDNHAESVCGLRFAEAVERAYRSSALTLNAAIDGLAELRLSGFEAATLASEFAGLLRQSATLHIDITGLLPNLADTLEELLRPILLGLAQRCPNLRVIAVEQTEGGYVSGSHSVLTAAKLPHLYQSTEHISIKSMDWLVTLCAEDSFAQQAARAAGAAYLKMDAVSGTSPDDIVGDILRFVQSARTSSPTSIARSFTNVPSSNAEPIRVPSPDSAEKKRSRKSRRVRLSTQ